MLKIDKKRLGSVFLSAILLMETSMCANASPYVVPKNSLTQTISKKFNGLMNFIGKHQKPILIASGVLGGAGILTLALVGALSGDKNTENSDDNKANQSGGKLKPTSTPKNVLPPVIEVPKIEHKKVNDVNDAKETGGIDKTTQGIENVGDTSKVTNPEPTSNNISSHPNEITNDKNESVPKESNVDEKVNVVAVTPENDTSVIVSSATEDVKNVSKHSDSCEVESPNMQSDYGNYCDASSSSELLEVEPVEIKSEETTPEEVLPMGKFVVDSVQSDEGTTVKEGTINKVDLPSEQDTNELEVSAEVDSDSDDEMVIVSPQSNTVVQEEKYNLANHKIPVANVSSKNDAVSSRSPSPSGSPIEQDPKLVEITLSPDAIDAINEYCIKNSIYNDAKSAIEQLIIWLSSIKNKYYQAQNITSLVEANFIRCRQRCKSSKRGIDSMLLAKFEKELMPKIYLLRDKVRRDNFQQKLLRGMILDGNELRFDKSRLVAKLKIHNR